MLGTQSRLHSVTVYSTEGGADKQYTAWLEERPGGFVAMFQFGPRGGWVQGGCKTPVPVPLNQAQKILDKLIREKNAKGYHEGEHAPAFAAVEGAVDTGLRPMLLTPADEADIDRYVGDDGWAAQEKMNGKRVLVRVEPGRVTGVNRRGLECPIPE